MEKRTNQNRFLKHQFRAIRINRQRLKYKTTPRRIKNEKKNGRFPKHLKRTHSDDENHHQR